MSKKLKIAIYSGDIPSTTFIERLITGLSEKPCEIYIFGFFKNKVSYNKSVSVFGYKNSRLYKAIYLAKYTLLLRLFKNKDKLKLDSILNSTSKNLMLDKVKSYPVLWHKPDVFHLQWAKGLESWLWVKEFGIKLVLSLRGAHINYSPLADAALARMYNESFPSVHAFHAVSEAIGKEAEKYNAAKDKIKVIYSGVSLVVNKSTQERDDRVFHMIFVGRGHWKKGYTYAIDACKILRDKGFKFQYTIIGAIDNIEYTYQIHDLTLTNDVILLNKLPYSEVQNLIEQSDLLLLPSVEEGIANVVLEAMSNSTLVLSTDCGGMQELVVHKKNGFIVPVRDALAIAETVLDIVTLAYKEKETIRQNAIQTIESKHSQEQMISNMLELYQSL